MVESEAFKELIWDVVVKAAVSAVLSAIPVIGFLAPILTPFITSMLDKVYVQLARAIDFRVIALRNEKARAAFAEAAVNLKTLAHEKGMESEDYQAARKIHQEKLSKLLRIKS